MPVPTPRDRLPAPRSAPAPAPVLDLARCPAPACSHTAGISDRFSLPSTDGPVEHAAVTCPAGHVFRMPVEGLDRAA